MSAFLFSLTFGTSFIQYMGATFGLCALAPAARGKQKILEVNLNIEKKITAKVNAFMLPDGEVDLNFQKGDE